MAQEEGWLQAALMLQKAAEQLKESCREQDILTGAKACEKTGQE